MVRNEQAEDLIAEPTEQKRFTNVYTIMLMISFLTLCAACTVLWFELETYGETFQWWKTTGI